VRTRRQRGLAAALAAAALAMSLWPAGAAGAEPPSPAAEAPQPPPDDGGAGGLTWGVTVGYGHGVALRDRQKGRDVADVRTLTLEPRLVGGLARAGDGSAWYHGRLEGTLEGLLMITLAPETGAGGGATAGLRYRMRTDRRVQPCVDGAIGLGGIGFDLASQDDGFAFFIQAGLGARVRVDDRLFLVGMVRWQHVSNAQTHLPNNGIDTFGLRLGLEFE